MSRLLGVDVDITICNSDQGWLDWLKYYNGFGRVLEIEGDILPYDLSEMFPNFKNPYQYWRDLDYNQFEPIEGSVEALEKLSKHFGIVFISRIKGHHTKSKYYWLKKHFPFMTEYVATHGKWVLNDSVVAMVDDRMSVLEKFDPEKRILFETKYTQDKDCCVDFSFKTWDNGIPAAIINRYL